MYTPDAPDKKDSTINGKCSHCGACCTSVLPVSDEEIKRIKKFLESHKVKSNYNSHYDSPATVRCPFLNENNECSIYQVRPEICRRFKCDTILKYFDHSNKKMVDMNFTFFPQFYYPQELKDYLNLINFRYEYAKDKIKKARKNK